MDGGQVSITSKEEGEQGERVLESNLTVTSPFLDGIGSYTCMAENVVDTASSTAEVIVYCELLPGIVVNKKLFYAYYFVTHTCSYQQTVYVTSTHPLPPTLCISLTLTVCHLLPSFHPSSPTLFPRSPYGPDCEPVTPGHIQLHCTGQPSAHHLLDRTLN